MVQNGLERFDDNESAEYFEGNLITSMDVETEEGMKDFDESETSVKEESPIFINIAAETMIKKIIWK